MDFSQILEAAKTGDEQARADLIQAAYKDLRKLAAARMAGERQDHTLTSTALVHEVSVKMLNDNNLNIGGRRQFFAYASKAMRNLLVDHARSRGSQKRGGHAERFTFEEAWMASEEQSDDLLALSEALDQLGEFEPRKAQVVEMRYFGGLNNSEIANALDISLATVKRDWDLAKMWLLHKLTDGGDEIES